MIWTLSPHIISTIKDAAYYRQVQRTTILQFSHNKAEVLQNRKKICKNRGKKDILFFKKLHNCYNTLNKASLAQLIAYVAFIFICFSRPIGRKRAKIKCVKMMRKEDRQIGYRAGKVLDIQYAKVLILSKQKFNAKWRWAVK